MKFDRKLFWTGSFWGTLLLIVLAAYWSMGASRHRLRTAHVQLRECEELAKEIQTLQDRPGFAALGIDSPRTITTRAQEAGERANLPPTALARIEPQSAVRLRDSDYRLRSTRLELRRVTLKQVLTFTLAMIDEAQGTTVRDIRLTASPGNLAGVKEPESWIGELVLTQLIFSP